MTVAAITGTGLVLSILYIASIVLVIWAVVDVARRPSWAMSTGRKAAWIAGFVIGWLLLGLVGGILAAVYLGVVRKRLPTGSSF